MTLVPGEEIKEGAEQAAAEAAKRAGVPSPTGTEPKAEDKTFTQAEADTYATEKIAEHYRELNTKLSANGVELAKLRPLEAENETLRTTVKTLENAADEHELEGAKASPTHIEVITMKRDLRTQIGAHNDTVRAFNIEKAGFDANKADFEAWNDTDNPKNPESIVAVATKFKVEPEALKDLPKEARAVVAKKLSETVVPKPEDKKVSAIVEDGTGQGGDQLTGQAGARAALDAAKKK